VVHRAAACSTCSASGTNCLAAVPKPAAALLVLKGLPLL
jgi:hypothetical protein